MEKVKLSFEKSDEMNKLIARISFSSPKNLNAIDRKFYEEFRSSLEIVSAREDIAVLIISSDLGNAFSAGVDVKYVQKLTNEDASHFFDDLSTLLDKLANFPLPTIAVVNGYTFGAGADIALSCDLRIASPSTIFRFPGPQFGLILGTQRLINEIGASKAKLVTLTNKKVTIQTALDYGLVHEVYEDNKNANEIIATWIKGLLRIPSNTVQTLKKICDQQQLDFTNLTKKSVLYGDFSKRFYEYIKN